MNTYTRPLCVISYRIMIELRRPISSLFYLIGFIGLFILQIYDTGGWVFYVYIGLTIIFISILINYLIHRTYIQASNELVTISRNLFYKTKFNITDIEEIYIQYTPFTKSYFKLTNGSKIKFDAWLIDKKDIDKLRQINSNIN